MKVAPQSPKASSAALRSTLVSGLVVWLVLSVGVFSAHSGMFDDWFGEDPGRFVIVFIDVSGSIQEEDLQIYRHTFEKVVDILSNGDRIMVGPIGEDTLTRFYATIDETIVETGRSLDDRQALLAARKDLKKRFDEVASLPRAKRTHILDALSVAEQLFRNDAAEGKRERWVVLLSDMLEDSSALNLEKGQISPDLATKMIDNRKHNGSLPDLSGVKVYVAGASAPSSDRFFSVRKFWLEYLGATGAECDKGMYVRDGLRFAEDS